MRYLIGTLLWTLLSLSFAQTPLHALSVNGVLSQVGPYYFPGASTAYLRLDDGSATFRLSTWQDGDELFLLRNFVKTQLHIVNGADELLAQPASERGLVAVRAGSEVYVPLRVVVDTFGGTATWDQAKREIGVSLPEAGVRSDR